MTNETQITQAAWPAWKKILFRFFFIYLVFQLTPWTWLDTIPGVEYITKYYYQLMDWAVETANANLFHVRKVLVYPNGSGDTSYNWTQTWLLLSLALAGCIIWSLADRKRYSYRQLNYWLCLFTRYYIALIALSYGFAKIFFLQMPFPNQSQLATPLGDFLPMRLSWMFIGYSGPYQFFSGLMEVFAGLLLLYRRTVTFGIMVATAVFVNVMVLNLTYDIPVKLFSMHLVLLCLVLLANEWNRIACFFFLNRPAPSCAIYHFTWPKKWMRISRIVLKAAFIILFVILPFYNEYQAYQSVNNKKEVRPIRPGIYEVATYSINKDSIPALVSDTMRWQDIVFEKGGLGSIKTSDTAFRQRYRRGYFYYSTDTLLHTLSLKKSGSDSVAILTFRYSLPDSNSIQLWGLLRNDSLFVELKRSNRHFQLAEKQFHWLSEYNR